MHIYEKQLEELILEGGDKYIPELESAFKILNQVDLGHYGIADIVSFKLLKDEDTLEIAVLELKRNKITWETVGQVLKYVAGIREAVSNSHYRYQITYKPIIVGKEVDPSLVPLLMRNIIVQTYTYDFDLEKGISFDNSLTYTYKDQRHKQIQEVIDDIDNHLDPTSYI